MALRLIQACGLYYHKFKVIRPSELWGDGKSLKKRRVAPKRTAEGDNDVDGKGKKRKRPKMDVMDLGQDSNGHLVNGDLQPEEKELEGEGKREDHTRIEPNGEGEGQHADMSVEESDLAQFEGMNDVQMASVLGIHG